MSDNPFVPKPPAEPSFRPRVWPGVVLLIVTLAMLFVPAFIPSLERTQTLFMLVSFAPMVALGGGLLWWLAVSRVKRLDRVAVAALFVAPFGLLVFEQLTAGRMPFAPLLYGVPFVFLLWVGWLVLSLPLSGGVRRAGLYVAVLLGWGLFATVRADQSDADLVPLLVWRWTPRAEDAFAARGERERATANTGVVEVKPGDWAEFRGPKRDNVITGVSLDPDAFANPKLIWKTPIGPGWGSFAVAGERLYTIEQVGDQEAVVCLDAATGKQVGERYTYPAKFDDPQAGAGPRSTPTVAGGRVYATGATGILSCLNATDLTKVWAVDLVKDAGGERPMWGFASCPLVVHGLAIVYTGGGKRGRGVTAFDAADGSIKWQAGKGFHGYSSAQLVTFAGVEQALMVSNYGIESFDPKSGKVLWEHEWQMGTGNRTCQVPILGDGELLLCSGVGIIGTKRLKVTKTADGWDVKVLWQMKDLSPYFNDGVVYQNHYYGFSGMKFHCIDLSNGEEVWVAPKGNAGKALFTQGAKYGNGQVLLFADQGLLLVTEARESLTETGNVFLLKATPEGHTELASFPSIQGKTWNHASFARGRLYLRNGQEAACYELPAAKKSGL